MGERSGTILVGDVLEGLGGLQACSVQCVVTSPPYWGLRDYGTAQWEGGDAECNHLHKTGGTESSTLGLASGGNDMSDEARVRSTERSFVPFKSICGKCGARRVDQQLGLEKTPEEYVAKMVEVFREVRRVLRDDGTLWLNIGDSYASGKGTCYNPGGNTSSFNVHLKEQNVHPLDRGNKSTLAASGLKPKDLVGIPWMLAFALRADGWYLRQDIIWAKKNTMPESVTDRCTKSHEYIFLMSKSPRYYFNQEAIMEEVSPGTHARLSQDVANQIGSTRANGGAKTNGNMKAVGRHLPGNNSHKGTTAYENGDERMRTKAGLVDYAQKMRKLAEPGSGTKNNSSFDAAMAIMPDKRNKRDVWWVGTQPFSEAHFATFPTELVRPCILAGSKPGDVILDPFCGAGTTGLVALRHERGFVGIELNPEYASMAARRITSDAPMLNRVQVVELAVQSNHRKEELA